MTLDIQTGNPKAEGRYVAFIRCQAAAAADWIEPALMTWSGGRWHSSFLPQRAVLGWIGPLPVLKVSDLQSFPGLVVEPDIVPLDYDL